MSMHDLLTLAFISFILMRVVDHDGNDTYSSGFNGNILVHETYLYADMTQWQAYTWQATIKLIERKLVAFKTRLKMVVKLLLI